MTLVMMRVKMRMLLVVVLVNLKMVKVTTVPIPSSVGTPKPSRSPATRRIYTSILSFPQWRGLTQTHFPPRQRKTAWHINITNVMSPHKCAADYSD